MVFMGEDEGRRRRGEGVVARLKKGGKGGGCLTAVERDFQFGAKCLTLQSG
jgi:hypothetical protein